MEALLKEQKKQIEDFDRLFNNYKKDGDGRKSEKYLRDKLSLVNALFESIKIRDAKLQEIIASDIEDDASGVQQPYFTENTFNAVHKAYNKLLQDIMKRMELHRVTEGTSNKNANPSGSTTENNYTENDDDDGTLPLIEMHRADLEDLIESVQEITQKTSRGYIRVHLDMMNEAWIKFRDEVQGERIARRTLQFNFNTMQRKYMRAVGELNDILQQQTSGSENNHSNIQFSLPKLSLPEFNGKISEWKGFISLFDRMVHTNTNLDQGLKIEYLKSCVKGEASKIINHIDATPENYLTCYDLLKKRYENKRLIMGRFLDNILNFQKIKSENADQLKALFDTANESIMSIKNLGVNTKNWGPLLAHILVHKLDFSTVIHYECQLKDVREPPELEDFLSYIENRFMAIQSANAKSFQINRNEKTFSEKTFTEKNQVEKASNSNCVFCNSDSHNIYKCELIKKKEVNDRVNWAKSKALCMNCLKNNHKTQECKSKFTCKYCNKKHNSLLHINVEKNTKANTANVDTAKNLNQKVSAIVSDSIPNVVMLATAIIGVETNNNDKIALRCLIDQGSQSTFITENAVQALKLRKQPISVTISGIGEKESKATFQVELKIFPRFSSSFVLHTTAIVLKKLTKVSTEIDDINNYDHLNNLCLADPSLQNNAPIDIILGAGEFAQIIKPGLIKKSHTQPIAQDTELGWIISGTISANAYTVTNSHVTSLISNVELNKKLRCFFKNEDLIDNESALSEEENYCEMHYKKNHYREKSGRYVVTLPFKNGMDKPELGESRKRAIATQIQLETRFNKNENLKTEYKKFIDEYIALEHMELATIDQRSEAYFLSHHCVFKESTTTKLRVVFNATQRSSNGKCLNEQLAMGKLYQPDLLTHLLRFRTFKYVFSADIEKMYRQILINSKQRDLQRIIWRESSDKAFSDFRLNTITYGTANAPYLAIRTLLQLAIDVEKIYPIAANIIKNNMYVDDVLSGCCESDELQYIYNELKNAFGSAHFNLRKWCSNSKDFLKQIPECDRELKANDNNVKALGIAWSPNDDVFTYELNVSMDSNPTTKRMLSSEIASLFDPLGWISPVIIKAKNLLQVAWKENIDWDDSLPVILSEQWIQIKSELHLINELKIPRWINYLPNDTMELHGFCDASEVGYAAVIYLKNTKLNSISLLTSKTKVAPTKGTEKTATIPRLELCGALLLAKLTKQVLNALNISLQDIFLWTDSKVVLAWLHGNPKRFKKFVANKICQINDLVSKDYWMHVAGVENPADCASRGILPSQLITHKNWWFGPSFLLDKIERIQTPIVNPLYTGNENEFECKAFVATSITQQHAFLPDVSSFYKMKRIMALCLRFVNNCKQKKMYGSITICEMDKAECCIIKHIQANYFLSEIESLKKGKTIDKSSKTLKLSPFLDDHEILRVGGRLRNASIRYNAKHQILLPKESIVTKLIITAMHILCMHGGARLTEATIRQKYWITNAQHEIKKVLHACIPCFKQKTRTMSQIMADLPKNRIDIAQKPFTNVAVDYTGAINYKLSKCRVYKTSKAYIAIFVCMATKAIHIELVSDATAEAFIAAFRRLVARRGVVKNIYSDNGTCFTKGDKDLQSFAELQNEMFNETICTELTKNNTTWHFSPPGAPHFNGLAEAAVKSVKSHLKKTIGEIILTFEELCTLLYQVEACVNSRPLCNLSSDPDDFDSLTPGQFLIGMSFLAPPDENHLENNINWLNRWQVVQKLSQTIWKRFQNEYLNQLQTKSKWLHETNQPKINDLVLVKEENTPSCKWPLARIVDTHKGDDNLIRVVTLKMKDRMFKRPITKLAPLPIQNSENTAAEIRSHIAQISRPKQAKKISALPMVTAMLAISTLFTTANSMPVASISKPFDVIRFDTPPGLYFEHQSDAYFTIADWHVIAYVNLQDIHEEYLSIESQCRRVKDNCYSNLSNHTKCMHIISQLESRLIDLKQTNNMIWPRNDNNKYKRATLTSLEI